MASNAKKVKKRQSGKKADETSKKGGKPGELTRFQKIVIVAFIAIFAFSTLASALASVVSTTTEEESTEETDETTVDDIDAEYADIVASLEAKLEEDPENMAAMLALGRYYLSWGSSVSDVASTDDETTYATELIDTAISYYDQYLALEDSAAARVNRAICEYYKEDLDAAVADLTEVTTTWPEFALAWAYLGMIYEEQELTDEALEAYEQAIELDPSDEYGAYSFAYYRMYLLELTLEEEEDEDTEDETTDTDETTEDTEETTDETDATEDDTESEDTESDESTEGE